jgi:hypothetical protein
MRTKLGLFFSALTILSIFAFSSTSNAAPFPTYEAESGTVYFPGQVGFDNQASGGQYVYAPPGTGRYKDSPGPRIARYFFNLDSAGKYYFRGRVSSRNDEHNSFWVQIDNNTPFKFRDKQKQAAWHWFTEERDNTGNLSTGNHTLTIYCREDDTWLDQWTLIYAGGGNDPSDPPGGGGNGKINLPKTGQTQSYGTRDDGELERGVAWPNPRFTDNDDGTFTDNLTRLIWDSNPNRFGRHLWDQALADCNALQDNGNDLTDGSEAGDWGLPNVREMYSLIDYTSKISGSALPRELVEIVLDNQHTFPIIRGWITSTTHHAIPSVATGVYAENGIIFLLAKASHASNVWCVKGGR